MRWIFLIFLNLLLSGVASAQPSFKGGTRSLNQFISSNLIYPEYARQNCLQGTIEISFKLDPQGGVFDSKVQNGMGIDLDDEALRIIRLTSGKWIVPPDHDTSIALVIPINFSLREYNCEQKSQEEINAAIAAYKAREGLVNAVINFYDKKSSGDYKPEDERKIQVLKAQLGFDEKFIDRTIKEGQQKLKQGDREGACENFNFVRKIGSGKADRLIEANCRE